MLRALLLFLELSVVYGILFFGVFGIMWYYGLFDPNNTSPNKNGKIVKWIRKNQKKRKWKR